MRVGDKALKALEKVHGTKYEGGATPELLYPAAGKFILSANHII